MKTLDEVIKANECCDHGEPDSRCEDCPYNGIGTCCLERESDALHYLKEYKDAYGNVIASMNYHLRKIHELEQNDPLTWQELKQMVGKPVWVEHKHYSKWLIVYEVYENTIVLDGNGCYTQYFSDDNDKEVRWKAYRKERS